MTPDVQEAMKISFTSEPISANLSSIFSAEEKIGQMPAEEISELRKQISSNSEDGFLRMWHGLVLLALEKHDEAVSEFKLAIQLGCNHWRVLWYLAKAAKEIGNLNLVDQACAAVLSSYPEFWFARELPKHARGYYAQINQDKFIEKFFRDQPPLDKVFVEVGAFDGRHYSNVRRLHECYGWTGVCIEPVQKNYKKLVQSYRNTSVMCVQAAVGNEEKLVDINVSTYPHLPDWGSDVASLLENEMDRWTKLYNAKWTKEQVALKRLTTILNENQVNTFDFLSVDAEAYGLEVLKGLDFARFQPQLIVIEYGSKRDEIITFLAKQGYSVCLDNHQDLFLAKINHCTTELNPKENFWITKNFTGITGTPPYEEIQSAVENRIHEYIKKSASEVGCIVIVGGYLGQEIEYFVQNYKNAEIHVFEPSQRYFKPLLERFAKVSQVKCHNCAVADRMGVAIFHEGSLHGIGSLLPLKTNQEDNTWIPENAVPAERYQVNVVNLDSFKPLNGKQIDLLWCDVQGVELKVLQGAKNVLKRCDSLFLEVSMINETYHGQCLLSGLQKYLSQHDFYMAGIGLCHTGNGTGNSLWLRSDSVNKGFKRKKLSVEDKKEISQKLNPHLLSIIPIEKAIETITLKPHQLLSYKRFDLMAKYLYAKHRELSISNPWAVNLYEAHMRVYNGCCEGDGSEKNSIDDYISSFNEILDSINENGFDDRISLVPIDQNNVIIDGAHRVAACLLFNKDVMCVRFDVEANDYSSYYFRNNTRFVSTGLTRKWCDAITHEYCNLNKNTFIATIFPSASGKAEQIKEILQDCGNIYYEKHIQLSQHGPFNLIRQMYAGESWLGNPNNNFAGAYGKAHPCFNNKGLLRVYVLESTEPSELKKAKERIRQLFNIGNHSIHINDSHEETVRLAQIFFNANSIHFLNCARPIFFDKFYQLFQQYKDWLNRYGLDNESFCVDGSAVMAAYGIRAPQDLDYLHHRYDDVSPGNSAINSHNSDAHHHVTSIDNIIFNPENHFYHDGVKFASLNILKKMKKKRGETKDRQDVELIESLSENAAETTLTKTKNFKKIVGLIAARNEEQIIAQCLRALSVYTDAIVFLDDASTDHTVNIVKSLAAECHIEAIIEKQKWYRDEPGDRNALLQAGRKIGGTHFIVLDADEMFTANCSVNNFLRNKILELQPGEKLALVWIQLWRSVHQYRFDESIWTNNYKGFIFCDDEKCHYESDFIHTGRYPQNLAGKTLATQGYTYGVLHFQFVNWRNLLIKQAWYRCLERIRQPSKSVKEINALYSPSKDETNLIVKPVHGEWFSGYRFFDDTVYDSPDRWREKQVLGWFQEYGKQPFTDLDIWDIDWGQGIKGQKQLETGSENKCDHDFDPTVTIRQAHGLLENGKTNEAIDILEELLESHPDLALAHNDLGVLYYKQSDKENALRHYQLAAQLQPENSTFQKNLADFYYAELGQVEEAMNIYVKVLSANPYDIETLMITGHTCVALEQFDDAQDFYNRVLKIDPRHVEARQYIDLLAKRRVDQKEWVSGSETRENNTPNFREDQSQQYLVSAIVSTYNAERFLRGCLEDLEAQTLSHQLEIIIINSGSEQNEEAIVKEFQQKYANIKYIKTQKRETVYAAWNRAIQAASGKYITNANTDDRHRKDAFEVMANILETLPEVTLVYADLLITETENETFERCTPVGYFNWMNWNRQDLLYKGCFMGPQPMWRKDVHYEYGYFDDSYVTSGDYEFWLRISQTHSMLRIPVRLGLYLRSPDSIEHVNRKKQKEENDKIFEIYKKAHAAGKIIKGAEKGSKTATVVKMDQGVKRAIKAPDPNSGVSIIIPTSNQQKFIKRCCDSIKRHTHEPYEIIFVNNGTAKGTLKWLRRYVKDHSNCQMIQCAKDASFAKYYNEGIKVSSGEFILLLSNDIVVSEGWLSGMLECFTRISDAGIIGPLSNYSSGVQMVANADYNSIEYLAEYAKSFQIRNRHRRIDCQWIDGFCMLFRCDLVEKIGLLDERFGSGGFEDKDFCIRAVLAGYSNCIAADVYLHRHGKRTTQQSQKFFNEKWKETDTQSAVGKKFLTLKAIEKGTKLYQTGQLNRAVEVFLEGIGLSPDDKSIYFQLAEILINAKQYKDAIDVMGEMPLDEDDLKKLELTGYCKEGLGLTEEAQVFADRLLSFDPESAPALNLKGLLAFRQGDNQSAQDYFNHAIKSDPGYGDSYTNLGALQWELDPEQALHLFERAFILSPSINDIVMNYHSAISSLDQYQRAEQVFIEARTLYPYNQNIKYKLIDILLKQNKYVEAMQEIEGAIAAFGSDDEILPAASQVREILGSMTIDETKNKQDTVSLCMIVKNEEAHLAKCLGSVKPIVDEMIVVDTGSSDGTKEIARVFGAKVYDHLWTGDFSEARNYSISKASGHWTFHLDADEMISAIDYNAFKKIIKHAKSNPVAYVFNTRNYTMNTNLMGWNANDGKFYKEESGTGWTSSKKVRLFPKDSRIQYEYPVHELVEPSLQRASIAMKKCDIPIHHYGKLDGERSARKSEVYYEMGRNKLTELENDPAALRELAVQTEILGKYEEAIELWQKYIAIQPDDPSAYVNMGISFYQLAKFGDVLKSSEQAIKLAPDMKEAHYNYALGKLHLGNANEAMAILEKLLAQLSEYPPAQFILAAANCCAGKKENGMELFKQLHKTGIGPGLPIRCHDLAKGFISSQRFDYALMLLEAAIDSNNSNEDVLRLHSECLKMMEVNERTGTDP
jgi:FkbM family methyltransferase